MTVLVLILVAGFAIATLIAPYLDARRKARREVDRCGRIDCAPRFDGGPRPRRVDPSPRPRRITDYEWRAIAEGMEQT